MYIVKLISYSTYNKQKPTPTILLVTNLKFLSGEYLCILKIILETTIVHPTSNAALNLQTKEIKSF